MQVCAGVFTRVTYTSVAFPNFHIATFSFSADVECSGQVLLSLYAWFASNMAHAPHTHCAFWSIGLPGGSMPLGSCCWAVASGVDIAYGPLRGPGQGPCPVMVGSSQQSYMLHFL